jgi:hypothetical protein
VFVSVVEDETYTEASAARLLRVPQATLHWWLEGRLPRYRPVIRTEPMGARVVTREEFAEAAMVRDYRRVHNVPLKELRTFVGYMRDEFGVPYPLADRRPFFGPGRRLVTDLQNRSHLDPAFRPVAVANGQEVLTAPGEEFLAPVDWPADDPSSWWSHDAPAPAHPRESLRADRFVQRRSQRGGNGCGDPSVARDPHRD